MMLMLKLASPGLGDNCSSPKVDEGWRGGWGGQARLGAGSSVGVPRGKPEEPRRCAILQQGFVRRSIS